MIACPPRPSLRVPASGDVAISFAQLLARKGHGIRVSSGQHPVADVALEIKVAGYKTRPYNIRPS
jgi:hypothetical protein